MGRHTVYCFWERALPGALCDLLVEEGRRLPMRSASVRPEREGRIEEVVDESVRKTTLAFWDANHWLNGVMLHFAHQANNGIWRYQISVSQGVQFATYESGGNYTWHKDEFDRPFGEESPEIWRGLARKITVIANLTDPSEYEGGELRMKNTYGDVVNAPEDFERMRQKGSVVVFPSYIPHAVEPVTRGRRYSLVTWVLGQPFV